MKYVADFSDWQEGIDFAEIARHFDGVIVKITEGTTPQGCFQSFIRQAVAHKLHWGVYCFTHALTTERAITEADRVMNLLPGKPELGIWFDIEDQNVLSLDRNAITAIASAFISRCNSCGYSAGIYASLSTINDRIITEALASYVPYWVAAYSFSNNPLAGSSLNVAGWQYCDNYQIGNHQVDASEWYWGIERE